MSEVPRLDLAPKLKRPLQLWNPLDYLRLLYWVFFFPQAIRWYVENFIGSDPQIKKGWSALIANPIGRRLASQALSLTLGTNLIIFFLWNFFILKQIGLPINWIGTAFLLTAVGMAFGLGRSMARSLIVSTTAGMAIGVAIVAAVVVATLVSNLVAFGVAIGVVYGMVLSVTVGVARGVARSVSFGVAFGIIIGVANSVADGVGAGLTSGVVVALSAVISALLSVLRIDSWLISIPLTRTKIFLRNTPLSIPGLFTLLRQYLMQDWIAGIHNVDQFLRYSMQFVPIVKAVNEALSEISRNVLLPKITQLAQSPYQRQLVHFASVSLRLTLRVEFFKYLFLVPSRWRNNMAIKRDTAPRLNTSARAAAAGFWYLYESVPDNAAKAFQRIRDLPCGEELFQLALALMYTYHAKTIAAIASLVEKEKLISLGYLDKAKLALVLRLPTWEALIKLEKVAIETQTVINSVSRTMRSLSLNRALGELNIILNHIGEIPEAEREIIKETASRWQEILLATAKEVGQITISAPVVNPYVVGDPVAGQGFVGREEILRRLEEWWAGSAVPPSVVLFGHRRMGKTSILRNLKVRLGASVHVAYVNLLMLGDAPAGAGDILLAIADSVKSTLQAKSDELPKIEAEEFQKFPYRSFEGYLKSLSEQLGDDRLIIALDEFEQLEIWMKKKRVPRDFLKVLRGYIQMDPHIAFAFAGLHTLEEMSADYFEPFFASVNPLKVGFLSKGAVFQLLANPSEEFPLDYAQDALQRIWKLTSGQPYLVQLIGHRLVSLFNDLTFEQGKEPGSQITVADVETVINAPDFYQMGRYYFTGVWGQAKQGAKGQQNVLKLLSQNPEGNTSAELQTAIGLTADALNQALRALERHDVILKQNDHWRFTVELMRRWVKEKSGI